MLARRAVYTTARFGFYQNGLQIMIELNKQLIIRIEKIELHPAVAASARPRFIRRPGLISSVALMHDAAFTDALLQQVFHTSFGTAF